MSNFLSYLADPTDPSGATAAVDLNGYERGASPFETDPDTFDLGAPGLDGVWLTEAGKDEDVLSADRLGRVESSFDLRLGPGVGSLPTLTRYLRELNLALRRGGVWVIQQPYMPEPVFADYYPSALVNQLMPGNGALYFLWQSLQQPNGMRVIITRRPKMRGFALSAATNLAHNGTFAEDHNHDGVPTFWSWSSTAAVLFPDAGYDWSFGAHEAVLETTDTLFLSQAADAGAVSAGGTYTFAVDVAASRSVMPTLRARIDWLDVYGAAVAVAYSAPVADVDLSTAAGGFTRVAAVGSPPPGAVGARYGLEVTAGDATPLQLWIRCAQFELGNTASAFRAGPEAVSNDATAPFGKRLWLWGGGNTDALAALRIEPSAAATPAVQIAYARRSGPRDSAMAMRFASGWHAVDSTALLNGATDVAGEAATVSGHALRSALANNVLKPMLRHAMTPPEESALRGTWVLHAALRGAVGDRYEFEARYGFGDVSDLPRRASPDSIELDLVHPPSASDYVEAVLGYVRVPPGAPGVWIELWAARGTDTGAVGTGQVYVDQLWLEPADDNVNAVGTLPGIVQPGGARTETIRGADLDTPPSGYAGPPFVAGSVYNTEMLLNDTNEACGIPLGWTAGLSAVEHTYVAWVTMYTRQEKNVVKHGDLTVWDLSAGGAGAVVASTPIKNRKGMAWDSSPFTVRFTPIAGHAYLIWVLDILSIDDGNLRVAKIEHSFTLPDVTVGADLAALIDASQRQARILEDDQFKANLPLTGPFPTLEPGVQLYRVSLGSLASNGYDGVLDDLTPLRHDPLRTALVRADSIPRWTN